MVFITRTSNDSRLGIQGRAAGALAGVKEPAAPGAKRGLWGWLCDKHDVAGSDPGQQHLQFRTVGAAQGRGPAKGVGAQSIKAPGTGTPSAQELLNLASYEAEFGARSSYETSGYRRPKEK